MWEKQGERRQAGRGKGSKKELRGIMERKGRHAEKKAKKRPNSNKKKSEGEVATRSSTRTCAEKSFVLRTKQQYLCTPCAKGAKRPRRATRTTGPRPRQEAGTLPCDTAACACRRRQEEPRGLRGRQPRASKERSRTTYALRGSTPAAHRE